METTAPTFAVRYLIFFVWNSQARNTSFPTITLFGAKNTVDYMTQAVLYESLCTFDIIFFAHQLRTGRIKHIVRASINLIQVTLKSFVQYTEESCQIILCVVDCPQSDQLLKFRSL